MEENKKPLNPIARARQQAKINKAETGVAPGEIDLFGNTEPIKNPVAENNSSFDEPVFNEVNETSEPVVVAEEEKVYTIGGDDFAPFEEVKPVTPKNDTIITPIKRVEPVVTSEPEESVEPITPLVFDSEKVMEPQQPEEVVASTAPETVVEEPKQKKEKPVRIVKENETVITPESIKEGKKCAWLAYILFFIPLFINKSNAYVRHNVNEGLEIFIFDVLAGILLLLNAVVNVQSFLVSAIFLVGGIVGWALLLLTSITKIYMIVVSLLGKVVQTPWCWKFRIIK